MMVAAFLLVLGVLAFLSQPQDFSEPGVENVGYGYLAAFAAAALVSLALTKVQP